MSVVGIDLAGTEKRQTGFCILDKMKAYTTVVYTDKEIIDKIKEVKPKIITIDAPLSLPKGRKSIEERTNIHLRECDRELLKRGIKFFPITLGPMRKLTTRGIRLKKILHLKTGLAYLENSNLLIAGEFIEYPEFKKFNRIIIDELESYAANCIWVNGIVLVPMGYPKTKSAIERAGYKVLELDVSEYRKLDGGLSSSFVKSKNLRYSFIPFGASFTFNW